MVIIHRMYYHGIVEYHFILHKRKQRQVSTLIGAQVRVYAFNSGTHFNLLHKTQLVFPILLQILYITLITNKCYTPYIDKPPLYYTNYTCF